jgi:ATP-dependent DNA helicase RecQ
MIKSIILDLDGTLINTDALEALRSDGKWGQIPNYFSQCTVYQDIVEVLNTARAAGIKVAIFTNSPSKYASGLLNYFGLTVDFLVAYHDVKHHKPGNEGVQKILDHFGISSDEAIYIGDSDLDKGAAANAEVRFFAVDWGSVWNADTPHFRVAELSEYIGNELGGLGVEDYRSEIQQIGNKFHLGYYLDGIKQEVWSFKNGTQSAIKRWTDKTLELATSLPAVDIVIRALGHAELKAAASQSEKPLDYLASNLASALGAVYQPSALQKSRVLIKSSRCSGHD